MRIAAISAVMALFPAVAGADTLIVGNKAEHTVSFIDLDTGAEIARRKTGQAPHEVAVSPDGRTAVVVSYAMQGYQGNTLHVFDVETAEQTGVIDLGDNRAPHGLKWIPGTSHVIATTEASQSVVVADVATLRVVAEAKSDQGGTHMVALSPDAATAYTANIASGSVSVFTVSPLAKVRDVKAGVQTEGITVSPDGKELWVGNNQSKDIVIFDTETFVEKGRIDVEGAPIRVEMSPDGRHVAVSHPFIHKVAVYEAASQQKVADILLSASGVLVPVTLLWSTDGSALYAAGTGSANVADIKTTDWSVADVYPAGAGSDGLGQSAVDVAIQAD